MHEVIALRRRTLDGEQSATVAPFTMARIRVSRFAAVDKAPPKTFELRMTRPIARRESQRLQPVAQRTADVEKWARRVVRRGKLRLFRLWKMFGDEVESTAQVATRPLAERLAWLRRTRRL